MIVLIYPLRFLELMILIRIFLSWISRNPRDQSYYWFTSKVDKILDPMRVVIPLGGGYIDLGPLFALLILQMLERIIIHSSF